MLKFAVLRLSCTAPSHKHVFACFCDFRVFRNLPNASVTFAAFRGDGARGPAGEAPSQASRPGPGPGPPPPPEKKTCEAKKKHLFHGRDRRSVTFGPLEWQGAVAATSAAARSERKARKALLRAPNVQTTVSACLKKRFVLATSIESQIDYVVVSRQLHS